MSFLRELARDQKAHERDFISCLMTWQGTDYPCSLTTAADAISLHESGGSVIQRTMSVHIRTQNIDCESTIWDWRNGLGPQEGDQVTVTLRDEGGAWAGTAYMTKQGKVGTRTEIAGRVLRLEIRDLTE